MRHNAHFGGLLKPASQEALSAWLSRGARSRNPSPFIHAVECLKRHNVVDVDGHLTACVIVELSTALGLSSEFLRRQFFSYPSNWLRVEQQQHTRVCEYCLLDDFRSGRPPSMKSIWFYWWFNVCPAHGALIFSHYDSLPDILFSFVQQHLKFGSRTSWGAPEANERRLNELRGAFKPLLLMALLFQNWYQASLRRGIFIIGSVRLVASAAEMEQLMDDLLAIIGKKSNYPLQERNMIDFYLNSRSSTTLRSDLLPQGDCEPFLCRDVGEHQSGVRMAMFAMLGLIFKLPNCVRIWELSHGDVLRGPKQEWHLLLTNVWPYFSNCSTLDQRSCLDWLNQRAENWNPHLRAHFSYLLDGSGLIP